jgi:hypothetical protein
MSTKIGSDSGTRAARIRIRIIISAQDPTRPKSYYFWIRILVSAGYFIPQIIKANSVSALWNQQSFFLPVLIPII